MFLAQIFCRNLLKYGRSPNIYRFEFSETNWYKEFPDMHTTLGKHEN